MFATVMIGALRRCRRPATRRISGSRSAATAPAAKVHTLDGKEADLAQYIGKTPMVIEFWATWCPNCKELEPTLVAVAQEVRNAGKVRRRRGVGERVTGASEGVRREARAARRSLLRHQGQRDRRVRCAGDVVRRRRSTRPAKSSTRDSAENRISTRRSRRHSKYSGEPEVEHLLCSGEIQ